MNLAGINSPQAVIGILVVVCCFLTIGAYVFRNEVPADYVIAIVASSLSGVLGFFFGHSNGTTSALATAATALANQAQTAVAVQQGVDSVGVTPKLPS